MADKAMTAAQEAYILKLCGEITGNPVKYLAQCREVHGWSSFQLQRGVGRAAASAMIDELKARVEAKG